MMCQVADNIYIFKSPIVYILKPSPSQLNESPFVRVEETDMDANRCYLIDGQIIYPSPLDPT